MKSRQYLSSAIKRLFLIRALEQIALFVMLRLPFNTRQWLARKIIPERSMYKPFTWRMALRDGIQYRLDLSQHIEHAIYWGFNDKNKERFYRLVKNGWVCADVGTNIGEVSLNLAKRTGPEGLILSFEPDPITFNKLSHNISLNKGVSIIPFNKALGEKNEILHLYQFQEGNDGANRILRDEMESNGLSPRGEVQIARLDDIIVKHNITSINLIKIDVEGFEKQVLLGAQNVLAKFKPLLVIEIIDSNLRVNGSSAADIIQWIALKGYSIERLDNGINLDPNNKYENCVMDIVCTPFN